MIRLGWHPAFGGSFDFRYRTIENESYSAPSYVRGHDFSVRYERPWRRFSIGGELYAGRDVSGEGFSRFMAFVRYAPSSQPGSSSPEPSNPARAARGEDVERPLGAELFVDAGVSASTVEIDLDRSIPKRDTDWAPALHVGIGARRAVTERQDLGVRLELDEVDDDWMLGARLVDYRFRAGRHLAFSGFFGVARWALATPAYGIYIGVGTQWRNLRPGWDLTFDARYAPNVARDDLLPTDPIGDRISSYRRVVGLAFYLTRSF
jgi:hypothetical protein